MNPVKLVNVRLSEDDAAKAADLQRAGVELSTLVREAVRARHLVLEAPLDRAGVRELLRGIYERHPLDEADERIDVDARDRRAVRRLVRARLRR